MNPEQNSAVISTKSKLESWAFGVLAGVVLLVPIIFIPIPFLQQSAIKGYLVIFGVLVATILYVISRFRTRSFEWISHPLSWVGIVLGVILLASSAVSGNFMASFFGQGYEYGSAAFLIILCIASWLLAIIASRSSSRAPAIYAAILWSFVLLAIFQIIKLIDPSALTFGLFTGATGTPIGSWYDLGIFSGVVFIITSFAFLYFPMSRAVKYFAGLVFVVSFFFLVLVDMPLLWFGIALVFLGLIFQRYCNEKKRMSFAKRLPVFAIVVFLIAALLSWQGSIVSTYLGNHLNVSYSELHLPWQLTLDVGTGIIKSSPILGSGPDTFSKEYLLYKPAVINSTQFWSTGFSSGSGLVPTIALSLGLCGIILFCLLYIYFIRDGVKALKKAREMGAGQNENQDRVLPYIAYSSFFASAFLLFMALVYVPSYAEFLLLFVLIGLFLSTRMRAGDIKLAVIPFNWKGKSAMYAHSLGVILLLVFVASVVFYGMKASATVYFTAGAAAVSAPSLTAANLTKAQSDFHKALALDPSDIYDQALVQTDLTAANGIVSQISAAGSSAKPTPDQIKQLGALINDAGTYAVAAVKRDPSNYYNYLIEAQVFNAATTLQMQGAYAAAVTAYSNAAKDNPYDPSIYLALAQLAGSQAKYDDATSYIGSALQLKNNYTDAVYLLSEIQVAQGKTADAITSVKFAVQLNPNDPTAYYELGLLQYNAASYSDAVTSLAKAVSLSPNYANAQYFLGLSYSKVGDNTDAITQFESLAKSNPGNADVASILGNLQAGKAPFVNQAPPVSTPEKRSSPPISDQPSSGVTRSINATSTTAKK